MAELNVQPKSGRPWWLWLLLALLALALIFFLIKGCNRDTATETTDMGNSIDSMATTATNGAANALDWDAVDFGAPAATFDEITDSDITIRGNDEYAIYSVDETVLFDTDKNTIKSDAAQKLKQVSESMGKRFADGQVRIYGYTDAKGAAGYNMQLAEQRAEAVKNWLTENGNVTADRISLHPVGESQPVASNASAEGRQQNRRVEIVARRGNQ